MKVVILAGGFGTRMSEYTIEVPKPMVHVLGRPLLDHVIDCYTRHGFTDIIIATGYKHEVIYQYYIDKINNESTVVIDYETRKIETYGPKNNLRITLVNTGQHTMTGGRIKRLEDIITEDEFMVTYGDGVSDVDIGELLAYHRREGKIATLTAVRPASRFGELIINNGDISEFTEKPVMSDGWINGGFFVFNRKIFGYIRDDETVLEREPLQTLARIGQLRAYEHSGFWKCCDTKKDVENLSSYLASK